jgi:hypothetical protein
MKEQKGISALNRIICGILSENIVVDAPGGSIDTANILKTASIIEELVKAEVKQSVFDYSDLRDAFRTFEKERMRVYTEVKGDSVSWDDTPTRTHVHENFLKGQDNYRPFIKLMDELKLKQGKDKSALGYEILSFYKKKKAAYGYSFDFVFVKSGDKFHFGLSEEGYTEDELLNNGDFKIHSVKRLSDNLVFTVGEELGDREGDFFKNKTIGSFSVKPILPNKKFIRVTCTNELDTHPLSFLVKK